MVLTHTHTLVGYFGEVFSSARKGREGSGKTGDGVGVCGERKGGIWRRPRFLFLNIPLIPKVSGFFGLKGNKGTWASRKKETLGYQNFLFVVEYGGIYILYR